MQTEAHRRIIEILNNIRAYHSKDVKLYNNLAEIEDLISTEPQPEINQDKHTIKRRKNNGNSTRAIAKT